MPGVCGDVGSVSSLRPLRPGGRSEFRRGHPELQVPSCKRLCHVTADVPVTVDKSSDMISDLSHSLNVTLFFFLACVQLRCCGRMQQVF